MIFLAITSRGLEDALSSVSGTYAAVWCGADALSEQEFAALKNACLTRFSYDLGTRDPLVIERALDTIDQHHPGEMVGVEGPLPAA